MKFLDTISEMIHTDKEIQIPRESLDSGVFQFFDDGRPPILMDSIKSQILQDLRNLEEVVPITDFFIVGDILTPYFTEASDIDVFIEVDPEVTDNLSTAGIFYNLKRLTGRYATNTKHKILYHIHTQNIDLEKYDAVYDIINERWIKRPDNVNRIINEYLTNFNETLQSIDGVSGVIRRDKIDLKEIDKLSHLDLQMLRYQLQKQYDLIENNLEYLVKIFPDHHMLKRLMNDNTLTVIEIRTYGKKLPEFIRMVLFKKYYFIKFIQRLDDMLIADDEFDVRALINTSRTGRAFKEA